MKKQAVNPYLPFWEHIPDAEPHVFDGRLYIYGSNDGRGGTTFCGGDYEGWSAPVDDLGNWRYEGILYRKRQDPINGAPYAGTIPDYEPAFFNREQRLLYAPDVTKGQDGRYYLYYALDTANIISVAVSDAPAGPYDFLGYVTMPDHSVPRTGRWFDPGVYSDESGTYLYYGFCPTVRFPGMEDIDLSGSFMVKLSDDMHTIAEGPVLIANGVETAAGTSFEEHPFFEASSIRKYNDTYYFVYSSLQGHELCYATSKAPQGPFIFGGVIISNADIGYEGRENAACYYGNNHGGLVRIGEKYYIFWHRQSHGTEFARQGCAEEVKILEDGSIPQVGISSCGLNGKPLCAKGRYETYIVCHLSEKDPAKVGHVVDGGPGGEVPQIPAQIPYVTEEKDVNGQEGLKPFIYNLQEGALAGFKAFAFDGSEAEIGLELRGSGVMAVHADAPDGPLLSEVSSAGDTWTVRTSALASISGTHALYFVVTRGKLDFASFEIY